MITGDYDRLQNIAKFNVCAQHHTPLEVAWYNKQWCLRCDSDGGHYPDAVTRQLSLTQEYKAGADVPSFIQDNIKKRQRRRVMKEIDKGVKSEFALVPSTDLGTGELLVPEVIKALVEYAHKYHLDPERSHVVLMYSKPYITIDGYLYHAKQTKEPYTLQSRPMTTKEEREYEIGETDLAWLAKVILTNTGAEFTGVGIVTYEEMTAKSPRDQSKLRSPVVAAHPQLLAQKRAEWQALRRAFPIGKTQEEPSEAEDKG